MKRYLYIGLPVTVAVLLLFCFPTIRVKAQSSAEVNTTAQKINEQSLRMLDEQADRFKRTELLLSRQEDLMKRQEEAFKRYERILDTWEKQQQQFQKYLDTLRKK